MSIVGVSLPTRCAAAALAALQLHEPHPLLLLLVLLVLVVCVVLDHARGAKEQHLAGT